MNKSIKVKTRKKQWDKRVKSKIIDEIVNVKFVISTEIFVKFLQLRVANCKKYNEIMKDKGDENNGNFG